MATLMASTANDPRPIDHAIEHPLARHRFRRIPMPATASYRLADAASMPGPGVIAVIVAEHHVAAVRAAGGTVVHLDPSVIIATRPWRALILACSARKEA